MLVFAATFDVVVGAAVAWAQPSGTVADVEAIRVRARQALAEAHFEAARELYGSLLALAPDDPQALREAGLAAQALREFASAADLLKRASELTTAPDPELHYLRGEALWMLGRDAEARDEHVRAMREIGARPTGRLPRLWLARIYGRLGDRAAADEIYDAMIAADPTDADAALAQAEMDAAAHQWASAERVIRRLLAVSPAHRRALEMLAWIEEARGQLADELAVREALARDSKAPEPVRDYGRALERSGDWAGALTMYRRAERLEGGAVDPILESAMRRMDQRMSIEVAAGALARTDPGADGIGGFTGVAVPFGRAHHLAFGAWHELVSKDGRGGSASELVAALSLQGVTARAVAGAKLGLLTFSGAAADAMSSRSSTSPSVFGGARASGLGGHVEAALEGEINGLWRESPLAELEGGRIDSVTAHLWANGFGHHLVVETGTQLRRLRLMSEASGAPRGSQALAWAGIDCELWRDFSSQAAGELLDDDLLQPTSRASSLVASLRHYELFATTNEAFSQRMSLADRASIDQASLAAHDVVLDGRLALELRTGLGYDWARRLVVASGGLSAWIATGASSRLSLTFEIAKEAASAFAGERLSGGMTYHVDL
jgi:tetratricopeptide (TPR) repeat protein